MSLWSRIPPGGLLVDASLWSANLAALGEDVSRAAPLVDLFHLDVGDGRFVPSLLFFPDLMAALRPLTQAPLHAHLMVDDPVPIAEAFAAAGADLVSVHVEAGDHVTEAVKAITAHGKAAGLALRVDTDPAAVLPYLDDIDAVIMVGTPLGTKGTTASPETYRRITRTLGLLTQHAPHRDIRILADGGIRPETVPRLAAAGAHGVVAGSVLFGADDLATAARWLHTGGRAR
jgi:ribulose-phosphate 3-epimerase